MENLLPLLFFFVFIALRLLGSRKPQRPAQPGQHPGELEARDEDMDEALRQIREALGMPQPVPRPAPAPPPEPLPAPRPVPPPRAETVSRSPPRPTAPRPAPSLFHDDAFAQKKTPFAPAESHVQASRVARNAPAPRRRPRRNLTALLDSPRDLQQALLLSEIFGPPRSHRGRPR